MSDITAIGLGQMGAALAWAIHSHGHKLTVWNRSPERMKPFGEQGVAMAADLVSAIAASPAVLVCIDNYAVTRALFQPDQIAALLPDRTVVQLSTGVPKEAIEASEWIKAHGASYLDGAILCGPSDIGTKHAQILLSGDESAYARSGHLLRCFGGDVRYLGPNVGAASALDLAWLTTRYGNFIAIAHAANLCKAEGASLKDFISLFPDDPVFQRYAKVIENESYDECTATLRVWGGALQRIQRQSTDAGINSDFPEFVGSFFKRAIDAGYGEQNVMALFKVIEELRPGTET
jgi:3-hydroxyisobutyrate dehydrogenase-like beta-hydroxyacid dehydrogenase